MSKPRTTPECERLRNIVEEGLNSTVFDAERKESARVALKRLRRNRCVLVLEYIIQISCNANPFDAFAHETCRTAREYLKELS